MNSEKKKEIDLRVVEKEALDLISETDFQIAFHGRSIYIKNGIDSAVIKLDKNNCAWYYANYTGERSKSINNESNLIHIISKMLLEMTEREIERA